LAPASAAGRGVAVAPPVVAAVGTAPALAAIPGLLAVVALAIDFATFAIHHAVDTSAFLLGHHTVGAGAGLGAVDRPLALLEAIGLAAGDLAALDALLDAVLLVILALIDAVHRLRVRAAADEQAARQNGVRDAAEFGHRLSSNVKRRRMYRLQSLRPSVLRHPSSSPHFGGKTVTTTAMSPAASNRCPNCPTTS